jgi:hypothetical protein
MKRKDEGGEDLSNPLHEWRGTRFHAPVDVRLGGLDKSVELEFYGLYESGFVESIALFA